MCTEEYNQPLPPEKKNILSHFNFVIGFQQENKQIFSNAPFTSLL